MSKFDISDGNVLQVVCPAAGVTSGLAVRIGSLFGVPVATATSGQLVGLAVKGNFALLKVGGAAITFAVGAKVYWNDTTGATATATDYYVGQCVTAAANADVSVATLLHGSVVEAVDADAVLAAVADTDGALAANSDSKVATQKATKTYADAISTALAKLKSGTVTISAGQSVGTVALGAATWDGKPVVVSVRSSAGAYAATIQSFESGIAAGTLTVTATDAAGAPLACTADVVLCYMADGR